MRRGDAFLMEMLQYAGAPVFKMLMATLRWRLVDKCKDEQAHRGHGSVIGAFWHGQLVFPAYVGRERGVRILISTHRDGEIVARIVKGLGYDPARGSSTRGGIRALKELVRAGARQDLGVTPDGPQGPRHVAQPGVILLAAMTGRPIVPIAAAAAPSVTLDSWDRFVVPIPFGRAALVYGDPILVPRKLDESSREEYRSRLEAELNRLTLRAEHACRR
jgi:lysophospholipid acyltransferase (LPLAT)-like uncharacterized protein